MESDIAKLTNEFIFSAEKQGVFTLRGDYKAGNIYANRIAQVKIALEGTSDGAKYIIDCCLKHDNPSVKIWGCGYALDLKYRTEDAVMQLKQVANENSRNMLGFDAEMSLKARGIETECSEK